MERREPAEYVGEDHCPACGHYLDAATDALDPAARPVPGDLSVCIYCGVALEFNPILKLQLIDEYFLRPQERAYIARLRLAMKDVRKKHGLPPSARQSSN